MAFAQVHELHDVEPAPRGNGACRLDGAAQVAGVDGVEPLTGEVVGQGASLLAAAGVQRSVGVALDAPFRVPVGLAVAREEDRRRHLAEGSQRPRTEA